MRLLLLISVVTWHVTLSSAKLCITTGPGGRLLGGRQAVSSRTNTFVPNFLTVIAETEQGNFICSPISLYLLLSMVTYGARGNTENQLRTALELPTYNDKLALREFHALIGSFKNYEISDIRLANKIFLARHLRPSTQFIDINKIAFQSGVQSVNFGNSRSASRIINTWVEEQTNHLIKDLTTPDSFDRYTELVLISAIYFKGLWADGFDPLRTKSENFYISETETKKVDMMHGVAIRPYGELPEFKATFLGLQYLNDYANDSMSMFIILPDEIDGLAEVENNFDKITLNELLRRSANYKVDVTLPKFKIESNIQLNEPLMQLGLTDMFSNAANFNGITNGRRIKVSKVVQKAFIEINESGTEAAAASSGTSTNRMGGSGRRKFFTANHPFITIIATTGANPVILFVARYKA